MMTASTRLIACAAIVAALASCSGQHESQQAQPEAAVPSSSAQTGVAADTRAAVRTVIERFGRQMQKISTLAPPEAVRRELPTVYGNLLSPTLLADWQAHPDRVIGREGSSPWPARIEVAQIDCARRNTCRATGKVDYITSNELARGGVFMRRVITLQLAHTGPGWRITSVHLKPARD